MVHCNFDPLSIVTACSATPARRSLRVSHCSIQFAVCLYAAACLAWAVLLSSQCTASSVQWVGGAAGLWDTAASWNTSVVPSSSDTVFFPAGASYRVTLNQPAYVVVAITLGSTALTTTSASLTLQTANASYTATIATATLTPLAVSTVALSRSDQTDITYTLHTCNTCAVPLADCVLRVCRPV